MTRAYIFKLVYEFGYCCCNVKSKLLTSYYMVILLLLRYSYCMANSNGSMARTEPALCLWLDVKNNNA